MSTGIWGVVKGNESHVWHHVKREYTSSRIPHSKVRWVWLIILTWFWLCRYQLGMPYNSLFDTRAKGKHKKKTNVWVAFWQWFMQLGFMDIKCVCSRSGASDLWLSHLLCVAWEFLTFITHQDSRNTYTFALPAINHDIFFTLFQKCYSHENFFCFFLVVSVYKFLSFYLFLHIESSSEKW